MRDVSRKTVTMWKRAGLLVFVDGLIDVVATDALLAGRPAVYRGGVTTPAPGNNFEVTGNSLLDAIGDDDAIPLLDALPEAIAKASSWTLAEATRQKEIYLALLRQLEFDRESAKVVKIDDVVKAVVGEYAIVRSQLLNFPARVAPRAAALNSATEVQALIFGEICEVLGALSIDGGGGVPPEELHQPIRDQFAKAE